MKLISSSLLAVALLAGALVTPNSAHAAGYITIGQRAGTDGGQNITPGAHAFTLPLEAHRSYTCTAYGSGTGSNLDFTQDVTPPSGDPITARFTGLITPAVSSEESVIGDNRISFTTTLDGSHVVLINNNDGDDETGRLDCVETTLYGGYNTNVNDFNFLELTNTTNATITGTVTAVNFDGTTVIDNQAFSVDASRRIDIDLHTAAGADKFGLVRVTHDGPAGALQGYVSQYSGTVSSFQLNASIPLKTRENGM